MKGAEVEMLRDRKEERAENGCAENKRAKTPEEKKRIAADGIVNSHIENKGSTY